VASSKKLDSLTLKESETQREKLINNEDVAWKSYDKLEQAKRSAIEMENISIDINRELHGHTEKIKNINSKVTDMNGELVSSNYLLTKMMRRENRNKLIIALISILLIICFIGIIYFKFFTSGKREDTPDFTNTNKANLRNEGN
jgi:hypothetical protein